jgi:Ca2+-binding RTX toxin-like protein
MKTVKIGNQSISYLADDANTLYTMAQNKTIVSQGYGLEVYGLVKNRTFEINGKIDADLDGVRIGTSGDDAQSVKFTLGETGHIISGSAGIETYGTGHVIRNEGTIEGASDGILTHGRVTIVNSGEISGVSGVNLFSVDGVSGTVRNTGSITGSQWSIYGGSESERVVNSGDLTGDVNLGGGGDTFIFKGGHIDGVVLGGAGNDIYVASATGLNIVEESGAGDDTVRASIDFTLQANVEDLYLTGKGNIDGIGNGSDNALYGNAGKNHLVAGFGFDTLNGGAGNDILEGGVGSDAFYFQKGTGKDIVSDYEATFDDIHFYDLKGAKTFTDMIEHHAEEKNGNVVLTFGTDVIVLKNHDIVDLKTDDFHFNM